MRKTSVFVQFTELSIFKQNVGTLNALFPRYATTGFGRFHGLLHQSSVQVYNEVTVTPQLQVVEAKAKQIEIHRGQLRWNPLEHMVVLVVDRMNAWAHGTQSMI